MENGILKTLSRNQKRMGLIHHPFLAQLRDSSLNRDQVGLVLGQWYHPLHYFPEFLARVIAVDQVLDRQSYVSSILHTELGEGRPERAHERLFADIHTFGFDLEVMVNSTALPGTAALVDGYHRSTERLQSALGFLYGTETVDLPMVSAIGAAIRRATGRTSVPWVDVHVQQEPDHVASAGKAVTFSGDPDGQRQIVLHAEEMWSLWTDFYDNVWEEAVKIDS